MTSSPRKLRAIITGASSGIGKATALAFAAKGINLALMGRSLERLNQVAEAAQAQGVEVSVYQTDLSDVATVKSTLEAIASELGNIDILVNNAGMGYTNLLKDTSLSEWEQVLQLNLTSVFQCIMGVLPMMRQQGRGTIINVASIAGVTPFPGWGAYSVSKAGLITLSKVLAAEERANGIRIVTISPGAVNTSIWDTETVNADFDRSAMLTPETIAQSILYAALLPEGAVIEEMNITPSAGAL
jgi:NADP-dependent 3-hydroxy acid dehydrogenase YdfG